MLEAGFNQFLIAIVELDHCIMMETTQSNNIRFLGVLSG